MSRPNYEDLPYWERPDLSPWLIHLTKNTKKADEYSAFDNLVNILKTGKIWGNSTYVKGGHDVASFMDVPFFSLKYVLNKENADPDNPRYEPFGIIVGKLFAYEKGCRPVLYLSDDEVDGLDIPSSELWRVVNFGLSDKGCISWVHEREWRCKGEFTLPTSSLGVLVKNTDYAVRLQKRIARKPKTFKALPKSIIPLSIVCQGLTYLKDYGK